MNIGRAIKELRDSKNLSQVELSNASGIAQTSISQLERGNKRPGNATLESLSKALGVSVATIHLFALEQSDFDGDSQGYDSIFPAIKQLLLFLNK